MAPFKLPFKPPADAWVLSIPVAYATFAFAGLITKTLSQDPELSRAEYYESKPEKELEQEGAHWNDSVRGIFQRRISNHRFGVFNNRFGDSPQ